MHVFAWLWCFLNSVLLWFCILNDFQLISIDMNDSYRSPVLCRIFVIIFIIGPALPHFIPYGGRQRDTGSNQSSRTQYLVLSGGKS